MTADKNFRVAGFTQGKAIKAPCRVATDPIIDGNIVLEGLQVINGFGLLVDDRILVKDQTDTVENGIYTAQISAWKRDGDWDGDRDVTNGTMVGVATQQGVGSLTLWQANCIPTYTPGVNGVTFSVVVDAPGATDPAQTFFQSTPADLTEASETLQTALTAAVLEDSQYVIECFFIMHGNDLTNTPTLKVRIDTDATFVAVAGSYSYNVTAGNNIEGGSIGIDANLDGITSQNGGTALSVLIKTVHTLNTNGGSAGNVNMQFAAGVGSVAPLATLKAGSFMRITKVA